MLLTEHQLTFEQWLEKQPIDLKEEKTEDQLQVLYEEYLRNFD